MESVHPLIVHFPIALLLTSVAADAAGRLLKRPALEQVGLWNLCLGALGAAAAVLTGLQAEEAAKHSFEIWKVMALHERLGKITLGLALAAVVIRLAKRNRLGTGLWTLTFLLTIIMISTLSWGAWLGGRLVYEFGVGGAASHP